MKVFLRLLLGAIGGVVATGPMTAAMIVLHRRLPRGERYPLPPREITMKLAHETGVDAELDDTGRSAATIVSHFAYGAVCGALYSGAVEPRTQPIGKGLLCGLLVWVVSYLGWLPAAGILRPATEHPARRNALMIVAHLVWGAVLGWLTGLLMEESEGGAAEPFSSRGAPHRDV